jgi:ankyrin repeat protein
LIRPASVADEKSSAVHRVDYGTRATDARTAQMGKKTDLDHSVLQMCLAEAARSGSVEMVDLWLHLGANPTRKGPGLSAMASALMSGNAVVVKRLLQYPVDVHERVSGETPLLTWVVMGRGGKDKDIGKIIRMLVNAGADVNERVAREQTPLSAKFITPQAIRAWVAAGARVDARDSDRETPLIYHSFDESDVRELLALGANPALVAGDGDTAAERARRYGCPPCAALLDGAVKRHVGRIPKAAVHPLPEETLAR